MKWIYKYSQFSRQNGNLICANLSCPLLFFILNKLKAGEQGSGPEMLWNRIQRIYAARALTRIRPGPFSDRCLNTLCAGDSSCSTCVAGSFWSGTGLGSMTSQFFFSQARKELLSNQLGLDMARPHVSFSVWVTVGNWDNDSTAD
jgi:hypothetical protein